MSGIYGGTATQTLMQHSVDGVMRGRVMALYGVIHRGAPALGAFFMGAAAELLGIQISVACGGIICLSVYFWMLRRRHSVAAALEGYEKY